MRSLVWWDLKFCEAPCRLTYARPTGNLVGMRVENPRKNKFACFPELTPEE